MDKKELADILPALGIHIPDQKVRHARTQTHTRTHRPMLSAAPQVDELFKQLDTENAGALSFESFMAVVFRLQDLQSLMKAAGITAQDVNSNPAAAVAAVEFDAHKLAPSPALAALAANSTLTIGACTPALQTLSTH